MGHTYITQMWSTKLLIFGILLIVTKAADTIPYACSPNYSNFDFCDTTLSVDERVNNLISLLTLDEKAMLLTARESPLNFIPRLGIPEYDWGANCIHGAQTRCGSACATLFPEPNALGATFNKTLISNISVAIGLELRALWLEGISENHGSGLPHVGLDCWSPTINIGRDPRWGRMYEIPSEDPYWNGEYGKYYTLGIQNGSIDSLYYDPNYYLVITTLKHFDAYSLEQDGNVTRHNENAIISPYMFEDTYFPSFYKAIVDGGAKGVMCSYNSVNGVPSCCNDFLLNVTLRQTWNFTGYITSDSGAIRDIYTSHNYTATEEEAVIDSLMASCDMNSGSGDTSWSGGAYGTGSKYQDMIPQAVDNGVLDIEYVNKALFNTLRLRFQLGLFDPIDNQAYWNIPGSIINNEEHRNLNLFAARSTQTLLKNKNNILPFNPTEINNNNYKIGVIGPHYNASGDLLLYKAYTGQICFDNTLNCVDGVLNGINKYIANDSVLYAIGCDSGTTCNTTTGFPEAYRIANESDYIVLMMGIDHNQEHEGVDGDRINISLPGYQEELASTICLLGKPTVLVLINGGMIGIDGLADECPSILESYYPGFRGSDAISDVIFGEYNPGGKLATTMYQSNYTQESNYLQYDLTSGTGKTYKYWIGTAPLFTFGYGLSYTQFQFTMNDSTSSGCNNKEYEYCIDITNIGEREGTETIFVFLYPPSSNIPDNEPAKRMIKKLIEFDKYYLQKNQEIRFKYKLDINKDLILYNSNGGPTIFAGQYIIQFSNGVQQSIKTTVNITNTKIMGKPKDFPN